MEEFFCAVCIAAMPGAKFYPALALTVVASVFGLLRGLRYLFKARLIEDMPTSRIRSASQGYAELTGLALLRGEPLAAPLTGRPCLWWRYTIERLEKSGKSTSWRVIERGHSPQPFYLDDSSGICRIEPEGAEISCHHRQCWQGSERSPGTSSQAVKPGLLQSLGSLSLSVGERYRYTEYLIRDGDPLYVLGHFVSDATGRRLLTVDQVSGQLIRHWKQDFKQLLVRFDEDGNGQLDADEWQKVTAAAQQEALQTQKTNATAAIEHSVRKPEPGNLPYLIGSQAQEQMSRNFRFQALAFCALFIAAGAMATWLANSRFAG